MPRFAAADRYRCSFLIAVTVRQTALASAKMTTKEHIDILNNMGQVLIDADDLLGASQAFGQALNINADDLTSYFNLIKARRASCDWSGGDLFRVARQLVQRCKEQYEQGGESILLPFDATLLPISNIELLYFSRATSRRVEKLEHAVTDNAALKSSARTEHKLRIGYASFDFNNHPMGHLTAGFMGAHNRSTFDGKL